MAKYGARDINFAKIKSEAENALPTYDVKQNLGALQSVTDSVAFNEGRQYGDDILKEHINEFKELTVDVEVAELSIAVAGAVFGAKATPGENGAGGEIVYSDADVAPWGGLAFVSCKLINNVRKFRGIFYPKVKAAMQGETYTTKGDSITLTGGKLHFVGVTAANGVFKAESDDFDTYDAAKAWCNAKLGGTA